MIRLQFTKVSGPPAFAYVTVLMITAHAAVPDIEFH